MSDLIDRLQTVVGDNYRVEKELGGGGMSRVFLAEEVGLGRKVVIKVLPPEMAAEVNKERFNREIQLAARLQHPLVVSLLTAGSEDDLLYYVMPYIEGESLRAKLAREGELPVSEAARMLKDVMEALAYAHRSGVVHRDIKPDNVLLTEGHAVVADFGVAKAVTASSGASSLTSLGVALGTPAYMAPEQAAADPHTDYRADIYAVGALAYEMLSGQPPFTGSTPQAVMAAHVNQSPEPLSVRRPAVPDALNTLVMRCLEKRAADRWQNAAELVPQLESMTTPSGGLTPTGTAPITAISAETALRRSSPVRVFGLYGLASVGALAIVYMLVRLIGLPDWVFLGAVVVLAIGLPIMMLTGYHERRRAVVRTTGIAIATPRSGIQRLLTWRYALLGGALAFAGLGGVTAVYMAMRLLGIGPVGTLVASGVLEERAPIVLADFVDRTGDSSLANALTEAFRVDLAQSAVVTLMPTGDVRQALMRMRRDPDASLDVATAQELAIREGIGAVVTGEINAAGSGFVLTTQLIEPETGNALAAFRETAADGSDVIPAIDRLSRGLRQKIGESFNTMRSQAPLEQVTTNSLEALQRFSAGLRAEQTAGQMERAIALFEEAVRLDSTFAMAYRKLSVVLNNTSAARSKTVEAGRRAFELRDRLPALERARATAYYYANVSYDLERAIAEARSALEQYPDDATLLLTLALVLNGLGRYEEAAPLARRARDYGLSSYGNEIISLAALGRFAQADSVNAEFRDAYQDHPYQALFRSWIATWRHEFDEANRIVDSTVRTLPPETVTGQGSLLQAMNDEEQGKLGAAGQRLAAYAEVNRTRALLENVLRSEVARARLDVVYRHDVAGALARAQDAFDRIPLESLDPLDRPYGELVRFYALAGDTERASELFAEYGEVVDPRFRGPGMYELARGSLAFAEGRAEDAVAAFSAAMSGGDLFCTSCLLSLIGHSYDVAGEADSAAAVYEKAVTSFTGGGVLSEAVGFAQMYRRLGEIYEARGDTDRAVANYNEFVELWNDADAELQPQVADVRNRIAGLVGER